MHTGGRAVFLSYASQDAEAAKKICEALRAAGVEVWFDLSELRGGDAWDQKIRQQIKECGLFVPVISANTNARPEGYFRLEWKLAVDRSHLMADDAPFLFPIVIGEMQDATARVPEKFRAVQWTRLRLDETPAELGARVVKLLSGEGASLDDARGRGRAQGAPLQRKPGRWQWWMIFPIAGTIMGLLFAAMPMWRAFNRPPRAAPPKVEASAAPAKAGLPAMPARDWPKDPELKRATGLLDGLETIPEDLRLAEEIAQRALDKTPTDPETVTVMARVHSMWLLRGWDRSTLRYQKAKATAERALQLAPDEPEAHVALAIHLYARGAEPQRAVELAQRAVDLAPQEPRFHRMRDNCLWVASVAPGSVLADQTLEAENEGLRKALAAARRTVELFPKDPLVRYELSRHYRDIGRWADFERVNEEVLAIAPLANALVWKARARFGLHGDLAGMKAVLDQVPSRVRGIERTVFATFLYAAFTGRTADGLDALNAMTETWMIDFDYRGPKALLAAALLEQAGKKELARVQYTAALAELQRARSLNAEDTQTYLNEAWILHGLGRTTEARAALRIFNESIARPYLISPMATWWFQAIPANLLLGERETGLGLMREAIASFPATRATIRSRLAADPRMASSRDDPEIQAILAEPQKK